MFIRMKTIGKQNWFFLISTTTYLMICVVAEKVQYLQDKYILLSTK